jgi:hypothetical protein
MNNLFANVELSTHAINTESNHFDELNLLSKLNLNFGKQIAAHLSLNFGPSLNVYVTREYDSETGIYGSPNLNKNGFFGETYSGTHVSMWVGYSVALKF